jgi:hypothetical protein
MDCVSRRALAVLGRTPVLASAFLGQLRDRRLCQCSPPPKDSWMQEELADIGIR